ncbi:hypothetical protein PTKIN_Ptkin11bG0178900 [Pterospermum kingtungense]
MDKRKSNRKRNSVQNGNGFVDGFIPTKAGKEQEGRKLIQNPNRNAKEVDHQKRDGTNIEQGKDAFDATVAGRQVGDDTSQLLHDAYAQNLEFHAEEDAKEVQLSVLSCESSASDTLKPDACLTRVKPVEEGNAEMTNKLFLSGAPNGAPPMDSQIDSHCCEGSIATEIYQDIVCSGVSTSSSPVTDVSSESCQTSSATPTAIVPPQSSEPNKNSKEFKLNPGAKIFSPSFANAIPAAPPIVPTVANVSYISGNSPTVAVASSQAEIGLSNFALRSSAPKFVSYGNITGATGVSGSQFSQPIVGHVGSRTQPLRYTGQYHTVQAAPSYLNPNSQAVMFGRMGQLICVPVSHDMFQTAAIAPVPARPPFTPHHVQLPKHQGNAPASALQLCVPQPFIASGQQPVAVPSHVPFFQPQFPSNRPIQVPGSNGLFSTKLP